MLDAAERAFVEERRTAVLATLSTRGQPRLVPICFVLADPVADRETILYSPLDEKPKRDADVLRLARVRDILQRPEVTLLFERWSEDWSELAWLRARGTAGLITVDDDQGVHAGAVRALRLKYPQYRRQAIHELPMMRIAIEAASSWSATPGSLLVGSPSG